MKGSKIILLFFLLILFNLSWAVDKYNPSNGFYNYTELTKMLKKIAATNKDLVKLSSIGKTQKGRNIWALQITSKKGVAPEEKQALLICGNIEGDHVIGSEVAFSIAEYLISNYGKDEEVTDVLDKRTFYIVPRLNPDGAELFFGKTLREYSGNLNPRDEDYDWQVDEDDPEDLNGDGMITLMRVKDKEGDWVIDKKDNRLMRKKENDTPLDSLYKIYPEGIDNDGDELYNEDGAGGFNIDRNFPHNFGYKIKGYKIYPASEKETRALIDFMNRYDPELKTAPHKNICGVLVFSKYDNLAAGSGIECGKATFPEVKKKDEESSRMSFRFGRPSSEKEHHKNRLKIPNLEKLAKKTFPYSKK